MHFTEVVRRGWLCVMLGASIGQSMPVISNELKTVGGDGDGENLDVGLTNGGMLIVLDRSMNVVSKSILRNLLAFIVFFQLLIGFSLFRQRIKKKKEACWFTFRLIVFFTLRFRFFG